MRYRVYQNILYLQVLMNQIQTMHVPHGRNYLSEHFLSYFFAQNRDRVTILQNHFVSALLQIAVQIFAHA